ncbi:MAG: class I SAM-dependent methyltransferase [Planctomycetota bacterium]
MGAGREELIERQRTRYPDLKSWGLDYDPSRSLLKDFPIAHCDFNRDRLPHDDGFFDPVTIRDVCEHLENFRHAIREAARVLARGGLLVVSTPNVLSMKSRWTFLTRGSGAISIHSLSRMIRGCVRGRGISPPSRSSTWDMP